MKGRQRMKICEFCEPTLRYNPTNIDVAYPQFFTGVVWLPTVEVCNQVWLLRMTYEFPGSWVAWASNLSLFHSFPSFSLFGMLLFTYYELNMTTSIHQQGCFIMFYHFFKLYSRISPLVNYCCFRGQCKSVLGRIHHYAQQRQSLGPFADVEMIDLVNWRTVL